MIAQRKAEEMTTPTEMSWEHQAVKEEDQAVPEMPAADPVSSMAAASLDPGSPAEPKPGAPDLNGSAAEPGSAHGADAEETSVAAVPDPEPGPASPSAIGGDSINLNARWHEILTMFVDDPRSSVELAAGLAENCADAFALSVQEWLHSLQSTWQNHDAGTEQLRIALQQYRLLCHRLEELSSKD